MSNFGWIWFIPILALIGFLPWCRDMMKSPNDYYNEGVKSAMDSVRHIVVGDSTTIDSLKLVLMAISEPVVIHDTVDVCNPVVKSIPDGYEQDRKEAQKVYDQWNDMNLRRICGCLKAGESPERIEELSNKYQSFKSVQHDNKIFDKEVAQYKKEICK